MFSVFATSAQLTRVVLSEQVGVGVGGTNGGQKEGLAHFLSSSHTPRKLTHSASRKVIPAAVNIVIILLVVIVVILILNSTSIGHFLCSSFRGGFLGFSF